MDDKRRRLMWTKRLVLVLVVGLLLLGTAVQVAFGEDILHVRNRSNLATMDPANYFIKEEHYIALAVYSGLVRFSANSWELEMDAAEWIEESADHLEITFKLREGIQWHGGYGELTTEDVKWSFERYANPDLSAYSGDWATLKEVQIIDKYTGKLVLSEPYTPLYASTLPWFVGSITCKAAYDDIGDALWTNPVGTGPYEWTEWIPKEQLTLTRFPGYFGEAPYFDKIVLHAITDDSSAELAFDGGELDWTTVAPVSLARYEGQSGVKTKSVAASDWFWLGLNVEHEPFDDLRVREAVRWAVDVEEILAGPFFGIPPRAHGAISPNLLGYWEDAPLRSVDTAQAKQLLADAGFPNGFDTELWVWNKARWVEAAEIIAGNLKAVGINAKIMLKDWVDIQDTVYGDDESGKIIPMLFQMYDGGPDPAWILEWYTPEQVNQWNAPRWANAEYGRLNIEAKLTLDNEWRRLIYIRMQEIMDEEVPCVWITYRPETFVMKDDIVMASLPTGEPQWVFFKRAE